MNAKKSTQQGNMRKEGVTETLKLIPTRVNEKW